MTSHPTERAFREYHRRTDLLDSSAEAKQRWFDALAASTYLPLLPPPPRPRILEIGCNRGYLLVALKSAGFTDLTGVDLAPEDLEQARARTGLTALYCAEGAGFLAGRVGAFDAIVFKAVLEHLPLERADQLLRAVGRALAPGGRALCEVPNMDWYAAAHERFMDLTHQAGYTRESLRQLLELHFEQVDVRPVVDPAHSVLAPPARRLLRRAVVGAARRLLALMGEDAAGFWFEHRSIIAVARSPRSPDP